MAARRSPAKGADVEFDLIVEQLHGEKLPRLHRRARRITDRGWRDSARGERRVGRRCDERGSDTWG
jgi:hypothetical protein